MAKKKEVEVISKEEILSELTEREKFCLWGYIATRKSDPNAYVKAYKYAQQTPKMQTEEVAEKKAAVWFRSLPVKTFIELYGEQEQQPAINARKEEKESSVEEDLIEELNQLKDNTTDAETKIKVIKEIVNIRHKNRDKMKDDTKVTRFYLPKDHDCKKCPLYKTEEIKINKIIL